MESIRHPRVAASLNVIFLNLLLLIDVLTKLVVIKLTAYCAGSDIQQFSL